jgi:hypothetical protein
MGLHQTKQSLDPRNCKEWEKIFASYLSDEELMSWIYRELQKLNPQRISNPVKKWAHELSREFSKEAIQMTFKYMKKWSTSWS